VTQVESLSEFESLTQVTPSLTLIGIRDVSHTPFSNFLHNRMQCTKKGAFKSFNQMI